MKGWARLRERLEKDDFRGARVLLGLDFDGTLAEIADKPEGARLTGATRALLESLAARPDVRIVVLSGRELEDLKQRVGLRGVYYAGNHGLQLEGPGLRWAHPAAPRRAAAFWRPLEEALAAFPGAFVEDKRLGAAVHYRKVPARLRARLKRSVAVRLDAFPAGFRVLRGKRTLDLRPAVDWDKGRAFEAVRRRLPGGWLGLVVGDDETDEEGFRTLGPRALTVRVGQAGRSSAQYRVRRRAQVDRLLALLAGRPVEAA